MWLGAERRFEGRGRYHARALRRNAPPASYPFDGYWKIQRPDAISGFSIRGPRGKMLSPRLSDGPP
jgi:hypothetical protein